MSVEALRHGVVMTGPDNKFGGTFSRQQLKKESPNIIGAPPPNKRTSGFLAAALQRLEIRHAQNCT